MTAVSSFGLKTPSGTEDKNKRKALVGWEVKFALLRTFKRTYGHCRVPVGFVVGGINLGGWVETQRKERFKFSSGFGSRIINDKRIARLEQVGFEWDTNNFVSAATTGNASMQAAVYG